MKNSTKAILMIEAVFVIGVLAYLLSVKPIIVAPVSGHVISEGDFDFEFENARSVIISRNSEFKNKIEFDKDFAIKLSPGTYFWKARGWLRESEARNFTIASRLSLRLDELNGTLVIYNTGNLDVNIRILDGEEIFGLDNKTILANHYIEEDMSGKNLTGAEIIVEGEQNG